MIKTLLKKILRRKYKKDYYIVAVVDRKDLPGYRRCFIISEDGEDIVIHFTNLIRHPKKRITRKMAEEIISGCKERGEIARIASIVDWKPLIESSYNGSIRLYYKIE